MQRRLILSKFDFGKTHLSNHDGAPRTNRIAGDEIRQFLHPPRIHQQRNQFPLSRIHCGHRVQWARPQNNHQPIALVLHIANVDLIISTLPDDVAHCGVAVGALRNGYLNAFMPPVRRNIPLRDRANWLSFTVLHFPIPAIYFCHD